MKILIYILILVRFSSLMGTCSQVPEKIRQSYAIDFYQAFAYQSIGKSVIASAQFQNAYLAAKNAGESAHRLMILEQLFIWYRMYGSSLGLFAKNPEGYDKIIGEYKRPFSMSKTYHSEWGKTPEQAALVREFMLGIAETISGVFCTTVGYGVTANVGLGLIADGSRRIYLSLNNIYSQSERALIEFRKWEENTKANLESR